MESQGSQLWQQEVLELPAVFRGSLIVNGRTSAAVRMQAGLKAITASKRGKRGVLCGVDDEGVYARDPQQATAPPLFSCNFPSMERISIFSSHNTLCVVLKKEGESSTMYGFEFQDAYEAQAFLKEALNKKNIKEWEIKQREKMERKILRKKSNSLSPQRVRKDIAASRSAAALASGAAGADTRQLLMRLSQAHIDMLLAAISSQPMTVITSAKALLKVVQDACDATPARYSAAIAPLRHEFSKIVEYVPQGMADAEQREHVLKEMASTSARLMDAVKGMLSQHSSAQAAASSPKGLPPPPNIEDVVRRGSVSSASETLYRHMSWTSRASGPGSRENLLLATGISLDVQSFDELAEEALRVCHVLASKHSPAKDAEALSRIVEKKCKQWLKFAFPWVSHAEPRNARLVASQSSTSENTSAASSGIPTSPLAVFLLCYRMAYDPEALLDLLVRMAMLPPIEPRQTHMSADATGAALSRASTASTPAFVDNTVHVLELLLHWVVAYWVDFEERPEYVAALHRTIEDLHCDTTHAWLRDEVLAAVEYQQAHGLPKPVLHAQKQGVGPTPGIVLQIPPHTLAEQMALYDYDLFKRVHPREYIEQAFSGSKQDLNATAPNLHLLILRFEDEGQWVAAEIVQHKTRKEQATMIAKFLRVAEESLKLHNYFSFFAIMGALACREVSTLKRAWRNLPDKYKRLHASLDRLTDTSRNMKAYRDAWRNAGHKPKLPFLPLHLKDLLFAKEAWSASERPWKEALESWQLVAKIIRELMMWHPYKMHCDYGLQSYLRVSVLRREPDSLPSAVVRRQSVLSSPPRSGRPERSPSWRPQRPPIAGSVSTHASEYDVRGGKAPLSAATAAAAGRGGGEEEGGGGGMEQRGETASCPSSTGTTDDDAAATATTPNSSRHPYNSNSNSNNNKQHSSVAGSERGTPAALNTAALADTPTSGGDATLRPVSTPEENTTTTTTNNNNNNNTANNNTTEEAVAAAAVQKGDSSVDGTREEQPQHANVGDAHSDDGSQVVSSEPQQHPLKGRPHAQARTAAKGGDAEEQEGEQERVEEFQSYRQQGGDAAVQDAPHTPVGAATLARAHAASAVATTPLKTIVEESLPYHIPSSPSLIALMQKANRTSPVRMSAQRRRQFALATLTSPASARGARTKRRMPRALTTVEERAHVHRQHQQHKCGQSTSALRRDDSGNRMMSVSMLATTTTARDDMKQNSSDADGFHCRTEQGGVAANLSLDEGERSWLSGLRTANGHLGEHNASFNTSAQSMNGSFLESAVGGDGGSARVQDSGLRMETEDQFAQQWRDLSPIRAVDDADDDGADGSGVGFGNYGGEPRLAVTRPTRGRPNTSQRDGDQVNHHHHHHHLGRHQQQRQGVRRRGVSADDQARLRRQQRGRRITREELLGIHDSDNTNTNTNSNGKNTDRSNSSSCNANARCDAHAIASYNDSDGKGMGVKPRRRTSSVGADIEAVLRPWLWQQQQEQEQGGGGGDWEAQQDRRGRPWIQQRGKDHIHAQNHHFGAESGPSQVCEDGGHADDALASTVALAATQLASTSPQRHGYQESHHYSHQHHQHQHDRAWLSLMASPFHTAQKLRSSVLGAHYAMLSAQLKGTSACGGHEECDDDDNDDDDADGGGGDDVAGDGDASSNALGADNNSTASTITASTADGSDATPTGLGAKDAKDAEGAPIDAATVTATAAVAAAATGTVTAGTDTMTSAATVPACNISRANPLSPRSRRRLRLMQLVVEARAMVGQSPVRRSSPSSRRARVRGASATHRACTCGAADGGDGRARVGARALHVDEARRSLSLPSESGQAAAKGTCTCTCAQALRRGEQAVAATTRAFSLAGRSSTHHQQHQGHTNGQHGSNAASYHRDGGGGRHGVDSPASPSASSGHCSPATECALHVPGMGAGNNVVVINTHHQQQQDQHRHDHAPQQPRDGSAVHAEGPTRQLRGSDSGASVNTSTDVKKRLSQSSSSQVNTSTGSHASGRHPSDGTDNNEDDEGAGWFDESLVEFGVTRVSVEGDVVSYETVI
ncbi:hypothetical protein PTSG_12036 [Salpingoeca rosetta]|uniref:Ras-GEF domain-containing protein n=1 Tax=Salpingoeca rosetta (strain ATCC 50818 / BSB-021) TaxID=946362 RepID=F2U5V8_SALR5|nr:uncharacterized protein PTSG_12036 [Salpingoeca rosetta]EGD82899.1 hypothetical protein PTSG_12036 [Salpingoeca rosetta]|eukprot:XP_004995263.1 hypothetical protein PTSG_12036 [Salpingoeca rosetta]